MSLQRGTRVEVRRGDDLDPLAGVVRIARPGAAGVDLIVGRHAWQREALGRASRVPVEGTSVAGVTRSDLVLPKLHAGGPQDAWDIDQILDLDASIANEVEGRLPALPEEFAEPWRRIREQRR